MPIASTAVIHPSAEIDPAADIGPYAIVEADVRIGAGTRIWPHAFISRYTTIGERCQVHPFAVVGHFPQDIKFRDAPSYTQIGDDTIIREGASIHRGTEPDSRTIVGARCFIMATAHVGHNCVVADDVILVNGSALAGHVRVQTRAFISGNAAVHQFCRIGEVAMVGGGCIITNDMPPFMTATLRAMNGVNLIGMRRAGLTQAERTEIRAAFRTLYRSGKIWRQAVELVAARCETPAGRRLVEFLTAPSKRGFMTSSARARGASGAQSESDT